MEGNKINFRDRLAWIYYKWNKEVEDNSNIIQRTKQSELIRKYQNRNIILYGYLSRVKIVLRKYLGK